MRVVAPETRLIRIYVYLHNYVHTYRELGNSNWSKSFYHSLNRGGSDGLAAPAMAGPHFGRLIVGVARLYIRTEYICAPTIHARISLRFRLGTGRMPQVKGQALHVRMRNRGDNTWFTCVRWCTRKVLTQLQTALQYHTMGYGLIPRPSTC